jgi:putative endonuclease
METYIANKLNSLRVGKTSETAVRKLFIRRGYREIARNYFVHKIGELDLVFIKDETVYIVEVKSRHSNNHYGGPESAISGLKKKKVYATASRLVAQYGLETYDIQFLAGCVTHNSEGIVIKIEILPF